MRDITRRIANAFANGQPFTGKNTKTDGNTVWLFNNRIVWRDPATDTVCFTMAGWGTVTTRDRLNGIYNRLYNRRPFHQMDYCQYFGDSEIGSSDVIREPAP